MRKMNFSEQIKHNNSDEWYTPEDSVRMIIPFLKSREYQKILCPFDKASSNFVKVLKESGFEVDYGHIEEGQDFFDRQDFSEYDAVVSNPPFSKREAILKRLFEVDVPFAMISCFNGLFDSKTRWKMFKDNRFELLIPLGRIHFFNEQCKGKSPEFQSVYVCKDILPNQICFADDGKRKET